MNSIIRLSDVIKSVAGVVLLATLVACGGGGLDPILGGPAIGQLPTVTDTSPMDSTPIETAVDVDAVVQATFSKPMQAASITASSFTLACPAGTPVAASVAYDASTRVATLTPVSALPPSTTCVATVGAGVLDSSGLAMGTDYSWSFVTNAPPTPPMVTFATPEAGATGLANNTQLTATFSKPMQATSITASSFSLSCPAGAPVAATVAYDATTRVATLTPTSALPPSTTCVATVDAGVLDSTGMAMGTDYTWSFVTAAAATPPTVSFATPEAGATGVAGNTRLTATFSKPMQAASITASSFTLSCPGGTPVAATLTYDAPTRVATLTPNSALPVSTTCVATVAAGVMDSTGLAMGTAFVWSFVTAGAVVVDSTRPTVVVTAPAAGATGVANNAQISATFSEAMIASTLNSSSFTLVNTTLGTPVAGSVSYAAASRTAVFTPASPATLPAATQFTATITTAATDLAGNALAGNTAVAPAAGNHVWTFTTGAAADTTAPTVLSVSPASGSVGICQTRSVNATFSEAMNATTINNTTLRVTDGGVAVAGIVSYDASSRIATFVPNDTSGFVTGRTFLVTIVSGSSGVKDLAGNAMSSDRSWSFTTVTQPCGVVVVDTTRPTVTFIEPGAGAVDVANNAQISATFSEAMRPTTLTTTSFTLVNTTLGTPVAGSVSYAAASRTAVFTPTNPASLPAATQFTATITTAAADLAGNTLAGNTAVAPAAGDHVWTFTTGAAGDTSAPTVLSVEPTNGSTNVCLTQPVSATFSEAMDATTVNTTTMRVTDGGVAVAGNVSYDAMNRVATFVPGDSAGFAASRNFLVTIVSGATGVKDLAGNALSADRSWSFTTGTVPCGTVPEPLVIAPNLGTAATFGAFGGAAGVTNAGIQTVIGGNVGTTAACTLMTGLHDASNVYTETPLNIGGVNGSVYCGPPAPGTVATLAAATQARDDAQAAYDTLAAMPAGSDPGAGQLGGLVLAGGVYTAAGGTFAITTGDLTLDGGGNTNTVWVFQSAAALTVGLPATPRRVLLINGARARNVYWQVGSAARIEDGSVMAGTIIAPAGVTISTAGQTMQTVLTGRAIGLTASVTMVNTTIVAP